MPLYIKISWSRETEKFYIKINDGVTTIQKEYSRCKNALKCIDLWLFTGAKLFDKIDRQYYKEMKEFGYIFQDLKGE